MKIALIQYSPAWENPEDSLIKLNEMFKDLSDEELVILPEMTLTGFTMHSDKNAEELDGLGTRFFMDKSRQLKKHIFAGIIERGNGKIYNSLVHFDKMGLIAARYRKIHPFTYAKEEKFYSTSRETLITKIDKTKFGLSVCYDLRFPELYRFYGKARAEVIVNIANWPVPRIGHWKLLLRARAIENQCFMIGVNRVGKDPYNEYNGNSAVFDPMGNRIEMVENEEKIISVDLDLEKVKETRNKYPFLQDIKLI